MAMHDLPVSKRTICRGPSALRRVGVPRRDRAGSSCQASLADGPRDWVSPKIAMYSPKESRSVTSPW